MGFAEQVIWSFMRFFANACALVGVIGMLGFVVISIARFTNWILNEEKEK